MTTTTLTITRALKEIETLTDRITKLNSSSNNFRGYLIIAPSDLKSNNRQLEIEKFLNEGKANYQSINALMNRRDKIKSLIILSNATNKVTINDQTMTVAEAIEKKKTISIQEQLLDCFKREQQMARNRLEVEIKEYNRKLEAYIIAAKGLEKQSSGKDPNEEFVANTTKAYANTYYPKIYEPFDFNAEISKLEANISKFKDEVDISLSEANAINTIEISD